MVERQVEEPGRCLQTPSIPPWQLATLGFHLRGFPVSLAPTKLEHLVNSQTASSQAWDAKYEWKAVTLLGLGFGLVGLDRWIIAPLFPFMMKDLHLGYQDLGNIVGVMGITWVLQPMAL